MSLQRCKPIECPTPRVNCKVNSRLWGRRDHAVSLGSSLLQKKSTFLLNDVKAEGGLHVWRQGIHNKSLYPTQFNYKPENTLKKKFFFLKYSITAVSREEISQQRLREGAMTIHSFHLGDIKIIPELQFCPRKVLHCLGCFILGLCQNSLMCKCVSLPF